MSSQSYPSSGRAALVNLSTKKVVQIISVTAGTKYAANGLEILFAETETALVELIALKGYTLAA